MLPHETQMMNTFVRQQFLREADMERLAAQLPKEPGHVRVALAARLHALADRLAPPPAPVQLRSWYTSVRRCRGSSLQSP